MDFIQLLAERERQRSLFKGLREIFAKSTLSDEDLETVRSLLTGLRNRINILSPAEAEACSAAFDVDLIVQMVRNNVFDTDEQERYASILFSKLATLCAPVQDAQIERIKERVRNTHLGILICEAHDLLYQIEMLCVKFQLDTKHGAHARWRSAPV